MKTNGLYRHYDKYNILLYVGISLSAVGRFARHKQTSQWAYYSVRMDIEWYNTRYQSTCAERHAIIDEKPLFNLIYNNYDSEDVLKDYVDLRVKLKKIKDGKDAEREKLKIIEDETALKKSMREALQMMKNDPAYDYIFKKGA